MNSVAFVERWAHWMLHSGWQAAIVAVAAMLVLFLLVDERAGRAESCD